MLFAGGALIGVVLFSWGCGTFLLARYLLENRRRDRKFTRDLDASRAAWERHINRIAKKQP